MKTKCLFLLLSSFSLWSAATWGQSVYKWVDENGGVHFGARPPAVDQSKHDESVELVRQDKQKSASYLLIGSWWGRSPDGAKLNLVFQRDGDFLHVESRPETRSRMRLKGSYQFKNDGLILEYEHSRRYEAEFNGPQDFIVSQLDDRILKLSHERRLLVLKRLQSSEVTPMSGEIYGKWFDTENRNKIYDFSHGRFKLLTQNRPQRYETQAEGNWDWSDPVLRLEVVVDYTRNRRYSGDIYQWRILSRHPESMTLRRAADGREMHLERLKLL